LVPNIIKEPRLYSSLNDRVTVRALFDDTDVAIRVDVDDRTYSVPGDEREIRYRVADIEPTRDAIAIQLPAEIPTTSEKPWFRHGDGKHPVNMWHWTAPSVEPRKGQQLVLLDANGPDVPPRLRTGEPTLSGAGAWKNGRWQVVFKRALKTDDVADVQFETGRHIPIAFANWDGVAGESSGRHSFTGWYWLRLEPESNTIVLYGVPAGSGVLAGLLFLAAVRRQRRKFEQQS
jgi:DMSO reductase family type II enzyme heme b subunit